MKALYRVPPDDPVVSAFIPLSTDVIACHGIPASNVYAENPPKSSGKPGALYSPASPVPCTHPRKGGRQIEKTHNTEGLGSENISMFFSNSIANKKGFLPRPAPFRAWGQGTGREAGSAQGDAMRRITGAFYAFSSADDGVFFAEAPLMSGTNLSQPPSDRQRITLDSSRTVPTAAENRPVNVAIPVILYLGLRA